MGNDDDSGLSDMELPRGARLTRPISAAVLSLLSGMSTDRVYFDIGANKREDEDIRTEKIRMYFHAAFYDRSRIYILILAGVLILLAFDRCSTLPLTLDLQAYGLLLDAAGAIIIAAGLFRGVRAIQRDTPTLDTGAQYGGTSYYEPRPLSSTTRNTVDGFYGGFFLFIGFSIQFIAVTNLIGSTPVC